MDSTKNKFLFNQKSENILIHEDEEGNQFSVNKYGLCTSIPSSGGGGGGGEKTRGKNAVKQYQKHSPRFFIIHKDSSGTELLRYDDISEYMSEVEVDPMTAIIRDNIQGYPNVMGTTVLRPLKSIIHSYLFGIVKYHLTLIRTVSNKELR